MEILDSKILLQEEEQQKKLEKKAKKKAKTKIQYERTRTAFERLQLAWIRASLTLITIGVGAYEYFHNRIESGKAPLLKLISGRELGVFLVLIAFIALLLTTPFSTKRICLILNNNMKDFNFQFLHFCRI